MTRRDVFGRLAGMTAAAASLMRIKSKQSTIKPDAKDFVFVQVQGYNANCTSAVQNWYKNGR